MLNKLIFDFGTDNITIFADNKIVFQQPSAIVITKTVYPSVVMYGNEALDNQNTISDEQMFILPIKKGVIAHFDGVRLLIKSALRHIKVKLGKVEICVLISCCLDIEQKKDIEKAFISAGCSNVYLLERLLALDNLTKKYESNFVCFIGGEESDIAILQDRKIISGYCLDMGVVSVNNILHQLFEETYKISLSQADIGRVLKELGSLYPDDITRMEIIGADVLSGDKKKISICSKDIYHAVEHVYSRILKVIEGALMAVPGNIVQKVADKGILFAGSGVKMEGFAEYVYKKLKVFPIIIDDTCTFLQECFYLISDEIWLTHYLGIK